MDEGVLAKIEEFGYPRAYVVGALTGHELNHATTTYYLMTGNK